MRLPLPEAGPVTRGEGLGLAGILVLALVLRSLRLAWHDAWADEGFSLWMAGLDFTSLGAILRVDAHPPLYYLLLKAWCAVAPCQASNPAWTAVARFPSVVSGVAAVAGTWWLGRWVGGAAVGLLGAFLLAISASAVMMDQEVRMYAFLALFCVLAHALFVRLAWPRGGQAPSGAGLRLLGYTSALVLACYTHYLGLLLLPVHVVGALLAPRSPRARLAMAWASTLLLFTPWAIFFLRVQVRSGAGPPHASPGAWELPWTLYAEGAGFSAPLHVPPHPLFWLGFVLLLAPAMLALRRADARSSTASPPRSMPIFVAIAVALPLVTAWVASGLAPVHFFTPKYFTFVLPPLFVLFATGVVSISRGRGRAVQWLTVVSAITVLSLNAQALLNWDLEPGWQKSRWRDAVRLLRAEYRSGDVLLVMNSYQQYVVDRYLETFFGASPPPVIYVRREQLDPAVLDRDLAGRLKQAPRVWVMLCNGRQVDPDARLVRWMDTLGTWQRETVLPVGAGSDVRGSDLNRGQIDAGVVVLEWNPKAPAGQKLPILHGNGRKFETSLTNI